MMHTFARSIPRTVKSLTQQRSFQVHDSRHTRREKNFLSGSRTSSNVSAYMRLLAVKMMISNISDTFAKNSWRKGLFRTYTVLSLSVIILNVKSAPSHCSMEEWISVSVEEYITRFKVKEIIKKLFRKLIGTITRISLIYPILKCWMTKYMLQSKLQEVTLELVHL